MTKKKSNSLCVFCHRALIIQKKKKKPFSTVTFSCFDAAMRKQSQYPTSPDGVTELAKGKRKVGEHLSALLGETSVS